MQTKSLATSGPETLISRGFALRPCFEIQKLLGSLGVAAVLHHGDRVQDWTVILVASAGRQDSFALGDLNGNEERNTIDFGTGNPMVSPGCSHGPDLVTIDPLL